MMVWLSIWWVWISVALVLGLVELLAPAFIFLGFSLAAVVMSALAGLGILPATVFATLALYAGMSLVAWIILRRVFKTPSGGVKTFVNDINE